jgi:hypothetical protein
MIRRAVVVVLILTAIVAGPAVAQSAQDSVRGVVVEPDGRVFTFNATSNFDGTDPSGSISLHFFPDEHVIESFSVSCLNVQGNVAEIGGTFIGTSPPHFSTPVRGIVVFVGDNSASGLPDTYEYALTPAPVTSCPFSEQGFNNVTRGVIAISDATS